MIFAISLSLSLLLMIFSVVKLQKFLLFEIIFIWVIVTFLRYNFSFIVLLNLGLWKKPEQTNQLWGLIIARPYWYSNSRHLVIRALRETRFGPWQISSHSIIY
jgi:hypothetical protein